MPTTDPHDVNTAPSRDESGTGPDKPDGKKTGRRPVFGGSWRGIGIYALVFALLLLLDAGRAAPMLERQGAELDMPLLRGAGELLVAASEAAGFAALTRFEGRIVADLATDRTLGAVPRPASAGELPAQVSSAQAPSAGEPFAEAVPPHASSSAGPVGPGGPGPAPSPVDAALADFRNGAPADKGGAQGAGEEAKASPDSTASGDAAAPALPSSPPSRPRVLLVGDSMMMEGFGPVLQRTLRARPDLDVIREGKYSTGLSRVDYFDWGAHLAELVRRDNPDLVVICLGANDPQDIIGEDGKRHHADSASWAEVYRGRAEKLLRVATAGGARVIWVGLPIMSKEPYSTRIRRLSDLQRAACTSYAPPGEASRARFVDTVAALADARGQYASFATNAAGQSVRLRYKDKVHVTEEGGRRMTAVALPFILLDLRPSASGSSSRK